MGVNRENPVIHLRALHLRDAAEMARITNLPGFRRGTMRMPFAPVSFWEKRISESPAHYTSIVAEVEGRLVGNATLMPRTMPRADHIGDLAMGVDDDWTGRGVGTMLLAALLDVADNWRGLRRLELSVYADNEPAIRLYKKHGFEIEGRHVKAGFVEGAFVDTLTMARLRF